MPFALHCRPPVKARIAVQSLLTPQGISPRVGRIPALLVRGRDSARELRADDFRTVLKPLHTDPLAFEYLAVSEMKSMQIEYERA